MPAVAQEDAWIADVSTLLQRRARAVTEGDEQAFKATMRGAQPSFVRSKMDWLDRMGTLPIAHYTLEIEPDEGYLDLSGGLTRRPPGDEIRVVPVTERIRLRGLDHRPSADTLYLTVVRQGRRWSIVGDEDLAGLGLLSARNVWDFADVEQIRDGPVLVLTQGRRETGERIARETKAAVAFVQERWPLEWDGRVVVIIPRSAEELGRVLQTTFDLGPFVAFASSSAEREDGAFILGGHRVFVQPGTFFASSESFQADTLSHELLHIATRADTGAFVPAWLDEGVAQIFGERRVPGLSELPRAERSGSFDDRLPENWEFTIGGRGSIHLAYERSSDFIDHLRDRYGARRVARFYDRLGAQSPVSFGTPRYHLDRAARAAFGRSFGSLRAAWADSVRDRF